MATGNPIKCPFCMANQPSAVGKTQLDATTPVPIFVVWNSSPERGESMPFSFIDWQPPASAATTTAAAPITDILTFFIMVHLLLSLAAAERVPPAALHANQYHWYPFVNSPSFAGLNPVNHSITSSADRLRRMSGSIKYTLPSSPRRTLSPCSPTSVTDTTPSP